MPGVAQSRWMGRLERRELAEERSYSASEISGARRVYPLAHLLGASSERSEGT
jgi:hypothetical protein